MGKSSLKSQNMPFILIFLVWNMSLYIVFFLGSYDLCQNFILVFSKVNAKDGIFITMAPLLAFILLHFIDANKKAVLVFWRIKNPLPGCRAFTEICLDDPRIDLNVLYDKLKAIPTDPLEQNRLWYKIYKQVDETITVTKAHQNFLCARDLATISFLILLLLPLIIFIVGDRPNLALIYLVICLLQYLVLCKVSQNTGERFVANVIAEYCVAKKEE